MSFFSGALGAKCQSEMSSTTIPRRTAPDDEWKMENVCKLGADEQAKMNVQVRVKMTSVLTERRGMYGQSIKVSTGFQAELADSYEGAK